MRLDFFPCLHCFLEEAQRFLVQTSCWKQPKKTSCFHQTTQKNELFSLRTCFFLILVVWRFLHFFKFFGIGALSIGPLPRARRQIGRCYLDRFTQRSRDFHWRWRRREVWCGWWNGACSFFRPVRIHIFAQIVAGEGTSLNFRESRLVKYYILGRCGIFTYWFIKKSTVHVGKIRTRPTMNFQLKIGDFSSHARLLEGTPRKSKMTFGCEILSLPQIESGS